MNPYGSANGTPSNAAVKDLLEERKEQTRHQSVLMMERRRALMQEISAIDDKLTGLTRKLEVIEEMLQEESPLPHLEGDLSHGGNHLRDAADAILERLVNTPVPNCKKPS